MYPILDSNSGLKVQTHSLISPPGPWAPAEATPPDLRLRQAPRPRTGDPGQAATLWPYQRRGFNAATSGRSGSPRVPSPDPPENGIGRTQDPNVLAPDASADSETLADGQTLPPIRALKACVLAPKYYTVQPMASRPRPLLGCTLPWRRDFLKHSAFKGAGLYSEPAAGRCGASS